QAIDLLFNHPNTGTFIGRGLIEMLVTSNPSPDYVTRITAVFNDNGAGVRGDLAAVVKAILLDPEARNDTPNGNFGKLLEPVLAETNILRNLDSTGCATPPCVTTDFAISDYSLSFGGTNNLLLGEDVFRSPTVFNFYLPDNPLPGYAGLVGPEFGIQSTSSALRRYNLNYQMIYNTMSINALSRPQPTRIDTSGLEPLATDVPGLVEQLNQILLGGTMSDDMRNIVVAGLTTGTATQKVRDAVYFVATSSSFQVQR